MPDNLTPLWHRREKESEQAFAAFEIWLRMPRPRKLDQVYDPAKGVRYPITTTNNWYRLWNWLARATAYDQWISDQLDAERVDVLRHQQKIAIGEHAEMLGLARLAVTNELRKLVERTKRDGVMGDMRTGELVALLGKTIELDRLMLGEATSRPNVTGTIDLSKLSDEDLARLQEIQGKVESDE